MVSVVVAVIAVVVVVVTVVLISRNTLTMGLGGSVGLAVSSQHTACESAPAHTSL